MCGVCRGRECNVYMEEVKYIWKSTTDFKVSCGEADA